MHNTPHPSTRRITSRKILVGITAVSIAILLSACGTPAASPTGAKTATIHDGGALRAALTGEPDVLDPATSSIYTGAQVYE